MNIREYLKAKYGEGRTIALSRSEANAFGIVYPLQKGWMSKHGDAEITDYMREKLGRVMGAKAAKTPRKGKKPSIYHQIAVNVLKSGPVTTIKPVVAQVFQVAASPAKRYRGAYINPNGPDFLSSYQWRTVRFDAIAFYGNSCACCGAVPERGNGVVINVDHIKPRKTHPHLALDINNLQILCHVCNHGKSNRHETDFRSKASIPDGGDEYSMERISEVLKSLK